MNLDILQKVGDTTCCATGAIVKDGHILLGLRNYTPDKWKDISVWMTSGGRCDEGETLEQTLRREVKEEVDIDDLEIKDFIAEIPGSKEGDDVFIFFCTTKQDPKLMEPEKFGEWKWVSFEDYLRGDPYDIMNPLAHKVVGDYIRKSHLV